MATTDLDSAMKNTSITKRHAAQFQTVGELHAIGWKWQGFDSTGRRIIMTKDGETCRIDEDGQARR